MMTARHDSEGGIRYRSRGGLVAFGAWGLLILAGVAYTAWSAALKGEPHWFFVIWAAGILVLGLYWTSLQVTLTPRDELVFRGLLRRQTWRVAELQSVRPGTFCIVFRFMKGAAMVASAGDGELRDMCLRIKRLNPDAALNIPRMFRLPPDSDGDTGER